MIYDYLIDWLIDTSDKNWTKRSQYWFYFINYWCPINCVSMLLMLMQTTARVHQVTRVTWQWHSAAMFVWAGRRQMFLNTEMENLTTLLTETQGTRPRTTVVILTVNMTMCGATLQHLASRMKRVAWICAVRWRLGVGMCYLENGSWLWLLTLSGKRIHK